MADSAPASATPSSLAPKRVLFICGSLRRESLNRQVGEAAQVLLGSGVETSWLDYADLPYMNQDIEFPTPAAVQRVRDAVAAADAVWICSPEYNHGIPGVLKNCLDWLSRPIAEGSRETVMQHKLVTFTCAGGGAKGRFAAADLAETLTFLSDSVILAAHLCVGLDRQDYTTNVLTMSPEEQAVLAAQVKVLLEHLAAQDDRE